MTTQRVAGPGPALLVFADVIDSSRHSASLGYQEYARRILTFQNAFHELGRRYFPERRNDATRYCRVEVRGDEGTVFVLEPDPDRTDLVMRAVEFLYHLKGRVAFPKPVGDTADTYASGLQIGAGIHFGDVAFCLDSQSHIENLQGFSINYAKRVETCSREGEFTRVFVSESAARLLDLTPICLTRKTVSMEGIGEKEAVWELRSALLYRLMIEGGDCQDEGLREEFHPPKLSQRLVKEPWETSLSVSLLESLRMKTPVLARQREYEELIRSLVWQDRAESDPILLYLRAVHCGQRGQHSRQLRYLERVVTEHPGFIYAGKELIEACYQIAKKGRDPAELVLARDLATEILEDFPECLRDDEEGKRLRRILLELRSVAAGVKRATRKKP